MTEHDEGSDQEVDRLRRLLQHYNAPPAFPAESLWQEIQRTAGRERAARIRDRMLHLPIGWAAAAATVLLALGVAAGAAISSGWQSGADAAPPVVEHAPSENQETKLVIWL